MDMLEFLAQSRHARLMKLHREFGYAKLLMPEFWLEVMRPEETTRELLQCILLLAKAQGRQHLATEDYIHCRELDVAEEILPQLVGYEIYAATRAARELQLLADRELLATDRDYAGPWVWVLPSPKHVQAAARRLQAHTETELRGRLRAEE
jgi:hypothetical protein